MISKSSLNIRDYFEQAGLRADRGAPPEAPGSCDLNADSSFSQLLKNVQAQRCSRDLSTQGGMSIEEYQRRPVATRISPVSSPPAAPVVTGAESSVNPGFQSAGLMDPLPYAEISTGPGILVTEQNGGPSGPDVSPSMEVRISDCIQSAANKYDLPPALIHSVIRAESNFQPGAVSRAGARGLMQLMPATAEELGVTDPLDIEQNIDGGARYLRRMLDRFGGDLKQALAAYNAGPGTVMRYNGDVPYAETRNYVRKVLQYTRKYRV